MINKHNIKTLSVINLIIVFFFISIALLNYYGVNFIGVRFVVELFTIPFFIAKIIFLIIGIRYIIQNKKNIILITSVFMLAFCLCITLISFWF